MNITYITSLKTLADYVALHGTMHNRTHGKDQLIIKTRYGRQNAYVKYDGETLRIELKYYELGADWTNERGFVMRGGMYRTYGVAVESLGDMIEQSNADMRAFIAN